MTAFEHGVVRVRVRDADAFADLGLAMFARVGHVPHRQDPARAAAEIGAFFAIHREGGAAQAT